MTTLKKQNLNGRRNKMEVEKINKEDMQNITAVFVDCVMMPNGELIRFGKTIGWVKDRTDGIFKRKEIKK